MPCLRGMVALTEHDLWLKQKFERVYICMFDLRLRIHGQLF